MISAASRWAAAVALGGRLAGALEDAADLFADAVEQASRTAARGELRT